MLNRSENPAIIRRLKVIRYANNATVVTFDTHSQNDNADKGRRVKHYVYKDENGVFWHERRYLSVLASPKINYGEYVHVSDRVFFGKARLVRHRDACLFQTWLAVAQAVQAIERIERENQSSGR